MCQCLNYLYIRKSVTELKEAVMIFVMIGVLPVIVVYVGSGKQTSYIE